MNNYTLIEHASHPANEPVRADVSVNGKIISSGLEFREAERYIIDHMTDEDRAMETYLSTETSTRQMTKREYRLDTGIFD